MKHSATYSFWERYGALPESVRALADKNFVLLKSNPHHPSLYFKKIRPDLWSVRVGRDYRALAVPNPDGFDWFWIGSHSEYDKLLG